MTHFDTSLSPSSPKSAASSPSPSSPTTSHYFTPHPDDNHQRFPLSVDLRGHRVDILTAPNVFSAKRLDPGTAVLLKQAPQPPAIGTFLDIGCGWGAIALALALESPHSTIYAIDINDLALELTKENALSLHLENIHTCTPSCVPSDITFDLIWSNPPIRIGKEELHALLLLWLLRLAPEGNAYLTVQKNLGADSLITWLTQTFPSYSISKYHSSKGYRIIHIYAPSEIKDTKE